jgi:hypothetical protein
MHWLAPVTAPASWSSDKKPRGARPSRALTAAKPRGTRQSERLRLNHYSRPASSEDYLRWLPTFSSAGLIPRATGLGDPARTR